MYVSHCLSKKSFHRTQGCQNPVEKYSIVTLQFIMLFPFLKAKIFQVNYHGYNTLQNNKSQKINYPRKHDLNRHPKEAHKSNSVSFLPYVSKVTDSLENVPSKHQIKTGFKQAVKISRSFPSLKHNLILYHQCAIQTSNYSYCQNRLNESQKETFEFKFLSTISTSLKIRVFRTFNQYFTTPRILNIFFQIFQFVIFRNIVYKIYYRIMRKWCAIKQYIPLFGNSIAFIFLDIKSRAS